MKLPAYLTQENLTASAFAARAGLPASTIIRILKGERSPRLDTIAKIGVASGGVVSVADFVEPAEVAA